jgi:hypothetical protein
VENMSATAQAAVPPEFLIRRWNAAAQVILQNLQIAALGSVLQINTHASRMLFCT